MSILRKWLNLFLFHAVENEAAAPDTPEPKPDANGEIASEAPDGASTGDEAPDPLTPAQPAPPGGMAAAIGAALKAGAPDADKQEAKPDAPKPEAKPEIKAEAKPEVKPEKPKTADDFELSPEEKKAISVKAQARFQEVTKYAKEQETRAAEAHAKYETVERARNQILGLLEETKTEAEDLGQLLDFNLMVKSGRYEDALKVVEAQRTMILKALGREAPGVDLLEDFPDLKSRADSEEITRQDALELAQHRRRDQAYQRTAASQQQRHEQEQTTQQQQQGALGQIEQWTKEMSRTDLDYAKKEAKVVGQISEVIRTYPPHLWLDTIKRIYGAIEVVRERSLPRAGDSPLRSSGGTTPGAPEPKSMFEAISQRMRLSH